MNASGLETGGETSESGVERRGEANESGVESGEARCVAKRGVAW